jgi:hypothetical protein
MRKISKAVRRLSGELRSSALGSEPVAATKRAAPAHATMEHEAPQPQHGLPAGEVAQVQRPADAGSQVHVDAAAARQPRPEVTASEITASEALWQAEAAAKRGDMTAVMGWRQLIEYKYGGLVSATRLARKEKRRT